jgi:AraC family transcriptional regulator of adaptative response/methylated-DNA-[protein]-cysteine methyltransferase
MKRQKSKLVLNFRAPGEKISGIIRYGFGKAMGGQLLVAQSDAGVCAVLLGDTQDELVAELTESFPGGAASLDQATLAGTIEKIEGYIEGSDDAGVIQLDIGGSEFQQNVWRSLLAIPPGETRSYREVAASVGNPQSVRAVGSACGANVLAVAIPCHRVVRGDGALSGYRWGVKRKKSLLDRERVQ